MVWTGALNVAGVPPTLEWRKAENVWFFPDISTALAAIPPPTAFLPPTALEPTPLKQPSATLSSFLPPKVPTELKQASDQGQGAKVA